MTRKPATNSGFARWQKTVNIWKQKEKTKLIINRQTPGVELFATSQSHKTLAEMISKQPAKLTQIIQGHTN